jgi:hypothetical protein
LTEQTASQMQLLTDRAEVIRVVDEIDNTVDAKDWPACRSSFLEEIYVDFTSLAGGSPGRMAADDLVGAWSTNLYADKPSFHMRTNHRVTIDGDRAEVVSKGYALNILRRHTGSDLWEVWGTTPIRWSARRGAGSAPAWRWRSLTRGATRRSGSSFPGNDAFHTVRGTRAGTRRGA